MEEQNPLVANFLHLAEKQKKKSKLYLILMLTSFACAIFLFYKLGRLNIELETKNEAILQASGYKRAAEQKDSVIKHLILLLEKCNKDSITNNSISESIPKTNQDARYSDSIQSSNLVYIQIRGNQESEIAKKLLQTLSSKGFSAPGIEKIDRKFKNRVFYFHDEDLAAAEAVTNLLRQTLSQSGRQVPNDLTTMKPGVEAPKGQIEVWLNLTD